MELPVKVEFVNNPITHDNKPKFRYPKVLKSEQLKLLENVMAKNQIRFQIWLSLSEFHPHYGTEERCLQALFR